MSTGLECEFVKWNEKEWYYILESWDSPKGAWDWREYANAYGPFTSQEAADDDLRANHANPGGAYINEAPNKEDPVLKELIGEPVV
jgi:hypothetical protein